MTFQSVTTRDHVTVVRTEGLLARMVRLWLEHHQRMMDLGIRQN